MKKRFLSLVLFATFLFIISCSSSDDDDDDDDGGSNDSPPDTNAVSYANTVKSIMDSNCLNCHSNPPTNSAPMPLTSYANVKDAVQNRSLVNRIERAEGSAGFMPQGLSKLSDAQIKAIKDWQSGGFAQ